MSSGHASHKGASIKPNTNANGIIDSDSGAEEEIPTETGYPYDDRGDVNPAAVERASDSAESQPSDQ
jgi:hypothetical protein